MLNSSAKPECRDSRELREMLRDDDRSNPDLRARLFDELDYAEAFERRTQEAPRVRSTSFAESNPRFEAQNAEAWREARRWDCEQNVYLWGPNGTGKTHLARCLLHLAAEKGFTVSEIDAVSLAEAWWGMRPNLEIAEKLFASVVLVDDIDKGAWKDTALRKLYQLANSLSDRRVTLVITSNLEPSALMRSWAEAVPENASIARSVIDRLQPCWVAQMRGASLRRMIAGGPDAASPDAFSLTAAESRMTN